MEIIAGKNGSFFVVTTNVDTDTLRKLADISFEEFGCYNAWQTMKRISGMGSAEYARKNGLRLDILEKFDRFADAVDIKATQDLMFFIENENGREQLENKPDMISIRPREFKNGFAYPLPRETERGIVDSFAIRDKDIPPLLKKIGTVIGRVPVNYDVKWNGVTYKPEVVPENPNSRKAFINGSNIFIGENCYNFDNKDLRYIRQIDKAFNDEKNSRQNSWYRLNKPENEILEHVVTKICGNNRYMVPIYTAMYKKYIELKNTHADYHAIFVHEAHHLRNRILLLNRSLKPNTKALGAVDMYYITVEDERSSHLAVIIDRINRYWKDRNWEELLSKEPCLEALRMRSVEDRNRLLSNLDFVTNIKLKHWTETYLDAHIERIALRLAFLQRYNSIAKGFDNKRNEYVLMRSLLYSYRVYNPRTGKYKMTRLDKYIKIDIPVTDQIMRNIIGRAKNFIDRKRRAKEMLKAKYGFTDKMIKTAANIYDASLRIRRE